MAKIVQNNFSSGEITPLLSGRSDLAAYYKACANSENFIVTKEGTLRKRHGLSSIASISFAEQSPAYNHEWSCVAANKSCSYFACASLDGTIATFNDSNALVQNHTTFDDVAWKSIAMTSTSIIAVGMQTISSVPTAVCACSKDAGITWTKRTIIACHDIGAAAFAGNNFLCETISAASGGSLTLRRSQDDGATWSTALTSSNVSSISTIVSKTSDTTISYAHENAYRIDVESSSTVIRDSNNRELKGCCELYYERGGRRTPLHYWLYTSEDAIYRSYPNDDVSWSECIVSGDWKRIFVTPDSKYVIFSDDQYGICKPTYAYGEPFNFFWSWDIDDMPEYTCMAQTNNGFVAIKNSLIYIGTISGSLITWTIPSHIGKGYKFIPYRYDRTKGGFILVKGQYAYFYDKTGSIHEWLNADRDEEGIPCLKLNSTFGDISDCQYKQIGDQLWLSNGQWHGIITVTDNNSLSFSKWSKCAKPDAIPCETGTGPANQTKVFVKVTASSSTGQYKTLTYGCYGVANSVISRISTYDATVALTWEAGNKVELFACLQAADVDKYDSVIVGKRSGSNLGILAQFYMTDEPFAAYSTTGAQCYRHEDGKYYTAASGGTLVTLGWLYYKFTDENHTPTDFVYDQTDILGHGFANPLCTDCYQQRRVFGNAKNDDGDFPMTLWFSEVGNIDNFWANRPIDMADPFSPTIATTGPAFINFMTTWGESLILFTEAGVYAVSFSQASGGFSSSTCRISKVSDVVACDAIMPVVTDGGIFFVGADKKTVFSLALGQNGLPGVTNRSALVEHLTRTDQIVAMAYQQFPDGVVWCVTASGRLLSITTEASQDVMAWSHSTIPGCNVKDVISLGSCTDSTTERSVSDVIFIVEKSNNLYICATSSGYSDLIGTGLSTPVVATVTTLRPESQQQSIIGVRKNIKDIIIRVYSSGPLKVRAAKGDAPVQELAVATTSNSSGYTGDAKVMPRGYVSDDGQLTAFSDDANACEILSITTELEVN